MTGGVQLPETIVPIFFLSFLKPEPPHENCLPKEPFFQDETTGRHGIFGFNGVALS